MLVLCQFQFNCTQAMYEGAFASGGRQMRQPTWVHPFAECTWKFAQSQQTIINRTGGSKKGVIWKIVKHKIIRCWIVCRREAAYSGRTSMCERCSFSLVFIRKKKKLQPAQRSGCRPSIRLLVCSCLSVWVWALAFCFSLLLFFGMCFLRTAKRPCRNVYYSFSRFSLDFAGCRDPSTSHIFGVRGTQYALRYLCVIIVICYIIFFGRRCLKTVEWHKLYSVFWYENKILAVIAFEWIYRRITRQFLCVSWVFYSLLLFYFIRGRAQLLFIHEHTHSFDVWFI